MQYKDLDILTEMIEHSKQSKLFPSETLEKVHQSILSSVQLNDRLMQLHWFIMQISSELELSSVSMLTLNAFYGLLNPSACSIYLIDSNNKFYEYAELGKSSCEGCNECSDSFLNLPGASFSQDLDNCKYAYSKSYPLFKRSGEILGYLVAYFHSSNVNISESSQLFLDIFTVQVGLSIEGVMMQSKLESLAYTDELTGLANKRVLISRLEEDLIRVYQNKIQNQEHKGVGLIMFDVDNFKHYNDTFGHTSGDVVLKTVGSIILKNCKDIATGARYGGEEMCVIINDATLEETFELAEKIRKDIANTEFEHRVVTVSGGITHYPTVAKLNVTDFINAADIALYVSKNTGKNKNSKFTEVEDQ